MAPHLNDTRGFGTRIKSLVRAAIIAFVAVLMSFWVLSRCRPSELPAKRLSVLTTAREVHGLTSEQASLGYPVRLHGIVTFYDPFQEGHRALCLAKISICRRIRFIMRVPIWLYQM